MFGVRIHRISGNSMLPNLADGDYVLSYKPFSENSYQAGDVVLLDHEKFGRIVKRILKIHSDNSFAMRGDSEQSVASLELGDASLSDVLGKIFYTISATRVKKSKPEREKT